MDESISSVWFTGSDCLVKDTAIIGAKKDLHLIEKPDTSKSVVGTYTKYTEPHMIAHYEQFIRTTINPANPIAYGLNFLDLIYYHVYGDYRMVYREGSVRFSYITASPNTINGVNSAVANTPYARLLNRDEISAVTGVYQPTLNTSKPQYVAEPISWLEEEINKASSGFRLMLPSIGTQIVTAFTFGDINKGFKRFVSNIMKALHRFIDDERNERLGMKTTNLSEGEDDYVLTYLLDALLADTEFNNLPDSTYSDVIIRAKIEAALEEDQAIDAIKKFVDSTITDDSAKFEKGESIYIKN